MFPTETPLELYLNLNEDNQNCCLELFHDKEPGKLPIPFCIEKGNGNLLVHFPLRGNSCTLIENSNKISLAFLFHHFDDCRLYPKALGFLIPSAGKRLIRSQDSKITSHNISFTHIRHQKGGKRRKDRN